MRTPFTSDLDPLIALGIPAKVVFDILALGIIFRRSGMEWFWIGIPWLITIPALLIFGRRARPLVYFAAAEYMIMYLFVAGIC